MSIKKYLNFKIEILTGWSGNVEIYHENKEVGYIIIHHDGKTYVGSKVKNDIKLHKQVIETIQYIIKNRLLNNIYREFKLKFLTLSINREYSNQIDVINEIFEFTKNGVSVLPLHKKMSKETFQNPSYLIQFLKYDLIKGEFV